jgi:hypothetical protein
MSYQKSSPPVAIAQQRHRKFTPERIQQITDLVARGESCEQIAAAIGVTVGSLKVTCSRLGISLRRPRVKLLPPKSANGTETTVGDARGKTPATFTIDMKYKGQEHSTELPFTPDVIRQLALEASFRDQKIGELVKDILVSVFDKGLVQELLGEQETQRAGYTRHTSDGGVAPLQAS